jgi:isopentenyldiphosphate isomerase
MIVDYIFVYQGAVDLALNENEVKSVRYVTKEELQELFAQAGAYFPF